MSTEVPSGPWSGVPAWPSVLAVVAHPDDESFGLGAILSTFAQSGSAVTVLCLTHGEASTIHGVEGNLRTLRAGELQRAARALGVTSAVMRDFPDGVLASVSRGVLVEEVLRTAEAMEPNGLVVFDPSGVTGHPDHSAATAAAMEAAAALDLPVLGWTLPRMVADQLNDEFGTGFVGHDLAEVDLVVTVVRERQRTASLAHASQAVPTSVLWRRLELLDDKEHLRWLPAEPAAARAPGASVPTAG